jgi:hypothetical protein
MTTNATFKFFTDNMGGTEANNYIGNTGEVFYDIDGTTPLRLSDGVTPGGIPFGIASVSRSFDPQFRANNGNTLSGTVSTGSYVKQGTIVHFRINVDFANTIHFDSGSTTDLAWRYATPVNATSNTSHFDLSGAYETSSLSIV